VLGDRQSTLADYVLVLRRRKWLVLVVTLVTVAAAVAASATQTAEYAAQSKVLINPSPTAPAGAGNANADAQARYDATQAQLAHTLDVATPAVRAAGLSGVTADNLLANSSVTPDASSNILTFTVSDRQPAIAVELANAFAEQFTAYRRIHDTATITAQLNGVNQQINGLTAEIAAAKQAGQPTAALHVKVNRLTRTQAALQNLKLLQTGGATIASSATSAEQTQPKTIRNGALAVVFGGILGLIIAGLREALDSRVRSADDVAHGLELPLLARLPSPPDALRAGRQLAVARREFDHYGEGYRKLRVALDYVNIPVGARRILITSAVEREGKSTTAANLAAAFAQTGRRVLLVDLDLRRPVLHEFFGVSSHPGVTDVIVGATPLADAIQTITLPATGLQGAADHNGGATGFHLELLPAGSRPKQVSGFLDSPGLGLLMEGIADEYDMIIVDSPPLLPLSDGVTLGGLVDGIVVIVRSTTLRSATLGELQRTLALSPGVKLGYVLTGAEADDDYPAYHADVSYYTPVGQLPDAPVPMSESPRTT
jgi:polysaccharide biosynthesis transport protein